jgi:glycosyltransferase involved in cell wall biosynthesis
MKKKIFQVLPTLAYGDAVSNDTINIKKLLTELGYETQILAENIWNKVKKEAEFIDHSKNQINEEDVVIYHKSTGTDLSEWFKNIKCQKKIMIYHNITPAKYFKGYSKETQKLVEYGYKGLFELNGNIDYCIADSEYNKIELENFGFTEIKVLPILMKFDDYDQKPDQGVIDKYDDDYTNILFVGRISANKKQENIIKSFYYYHKYYNNKSRLFLVGSPLGMDKYDNELKDFVDELEISQSVFFTRHIPFSQILSYYHIADLFLCASEHEGFCVPLLEAMYFDIPVLAYNTTAIPYTLGDAGVMYSKLNYPNIAREIDDIISDQEKIDCIVTKQKERLNYFRYEEVKKQYIELFSEIFK